MSTPPSNPLSNHPSSHPSVPVIKDEILIESPVAIELLLHDQKKKILELLIEKDMNLMELKNVTGINPGTIKRYIFEMKDAGLVIPTIEKMHQNGIRMQFYRAKAKHFVIHFRWP